MANETRLIDANDLWSDIMMLPHNGDMISSEEVEQAIMDAPTVDAVEVVHGQWANVQTLGRGCIGFCSNCMTPHKANNVAALRMSYRYCRWCGVKMNKEA